MTTPTSETTKTTTADTNTCTPAEEYSKFVRLQTEMLDALRAAEENTCQSTMDNLVAAMKSFREAGGGDSDNYRYCNQRYHALRDDVCDCACCEGTCGCDHDDDCDCRDCLGDYETSCEDHY